jgi:hypothetical protein
MGTPGKAAGGTWFRPVLLLLSLSAAASAQSDTAWLFRYPGAGNGCHEPLTSFVDDTGNVYVVGWSHKLADRLDALLLKIDSLGHPVWAATYDHVTAAGSARDRSGNIYIAGVTNGTSVDGKICVLKYRPNGNVVWVRAYSEPGKSFTALGTIAVDDSQNVYACAAAESASCFTVRVVKYLPSGIPVGVMRYTLCGYAYLWYGEFHILGNGEAYLALSAFNPDVDADWVVVKLSANSRVLWDRVYKDSGDAWELLTWSEVDENANIYLTGEVVSDVYGTEVLCTMKMDSTGRIRWTSEYLGPDSLRGLPRFLQLANGNVYVSGWNVCNKSGQEPAMAVVKYDSLGNKLWAGQWGGADTASVPGYTDENLNPTHGLNSCSMSVDDSGNVYITGTGSTSSYSPFAVLLKYDSQGRLVWARRRPGAAWNGAVVGLDNKGALYDIGFGGSAGVGGIYVLKYRTR